MRVMKTLPIFGTLLSAMALLPLAYAGVPGVMTKGVVGLSQILVFFRVSEIVRFVDGAGEPAKLFVFGSLLVTIAVLVRRRMLPPEQDAE